MLLAATAARGQWGSLGRPKRDRRGGVAVGPPQGSMSRGQRSEVIPRGLSEEKRAAACFSLTRVASVTAAADWSPTKFCSTHSERAVRRDG